MDVRLQSLLLVTETPLAPAINAKTHRLFRRYTRSADIHLKGARFIARGKFDAPRGATVDPGVSWDQPATMRSTSSVQ
jgi:hypothetical protein